MKLTNILVNILISFLVSFGVVCFVNWDLNVGSWEIGARVFVIACAICVFIILQIFCIINETDNHKDKKG